MAQTGIIDITKTTGGVVLTPAQHKEHAAEQHRRAKEREKAEKQAAIEAGIPLTDSAETHDLHAGKGEEQRLGESDERVSLGLETETVRPRKRGGKKKK